MSHTSADRAALLARVRRLRGQIEGVERALDQGAPCADILNLAASIRGAAQGLVVELLEDHLTEHVVKVADDADRARGAAELTEVIRRYLK